MDFKAFQNLPAAEGEEHGPYQRLFDIFHEWSTIFAKFGGIPPTEVLIAQEIQDLFTRNQWENKSEQEIPNDIKWYSAELSKLQNKQAILEAIAAKIGDMGDQRVKSDFIHPSMRLLLDDNIDTQKLEAIRGALNGLDAKALQGLMRTYRDLASEISVLRKLEDHEKGTCDPIKFKIQYEDLFRSLAEYESGKDIMPLLTVALGEAQTLHRLLRLSAGYFINVADFEKQHPGEYRQIFEAIAAQNTSSENSPPVEQIKLWLQGWENSDDPEEKIRLYLEALNKPDKEKTSVAEGDTLLSGASTSETPSEEVTTSASAPAAAPAAEAAAEAAAPEAEAASEPTSQQRQNPFQKLGQTILSLPVISQIKRGVLGLTAAAVIATDPLQKLINKHRKGLLISGSGVAGVLGLGVLAAKNLGSGPAAPAPTAPAAAPAVDLAELSNGTPLINVALEVTKNDFTKTKPSWVSLERYLGMPNVDIISNNPPNSAAIEKALITLKASMAKGGMASSDGAVQDATRESIEKIAELTGINQDEFVRAYTDARNAVNGKILNGQMVTDNTHTQAVHHEKMGKALDALSAKITQSRASSRASGDTTMSFSVGHGGGGDRTLIASANTGGIVSDTPMGILPAQHQSPLATMMQSAGSRLEGVAHNVAVVAQHPAAQAAMKTLGVVGVVASVTATVHAARNGQKSLAVMNAATAVATTAAMAGLHPLAAAMGAARIGAYAADRSGAETLNRVTAQKEKLANKLATLKAESPTLGSQVQTVTTNVALATKTVDVFASQQLNALRENVQSGVEATSQMLTQAQEVTGNAVASTRQNLDKLQQKFASLFNRQATAAL